HRHVHDRRVGQPPVALGELFAAHADALVGDGDHEPAAVDAAAGDDDPGVVRGERHGVLDQLGEQVDDVVDRLAGDGRVRLDLDADPVVALDLAERGPDHVHQLNRLAPLARGLLTGQDQQVLGVAAHAGGQVVELEQVGQPVV